MTPVVLETTSGRRLEAVASTEHPAASHGQAVILLEGEPVGPRDLLPILEDGALAGVDAFFVTVPHAADTICEALARAGYPVRRAPKLPGDDRANLAAAVLLTFAAELIEQPEPRRAVRRALDLGPAALDGHEVAELRRWARARVALPAREERIAAACVILALDRLAAEGGAP